MSTALLRVSAAPFVAVLGALALVAFATALIFEWVGDLARACPDPENRS